MSTKHTAEWDDLKFSIPTTEQEYILRRMIVMARQIRQNGQLKRILRKIDPAGREAFYELLKPHLSFKPHSYSVISKWLA